MPPLLTADDIIPLVGTVPPTRDEFSVEGELLAWDADGWDEFP